MNTGPTDSGSPATNSLDNAARPKVADRTTWQAELDDLRLREKAHTREGDAIAAARRRLPMVEVDAGITVEGAQGSTTLLDVFEGRRQLMTYLHMWHDGQPAAEQCEGCTFFTGHVRELAYLHSRDITYATFCQGPYDESARYHAFMGWEMPWYSVRDSAEDLLAGRDFGGLLCFLRDGDRVFETYWTTSRGVEAMTNSYALMDLTVYGRQEVWQDVPEGWRNEIATAGQQFRWNGRPSSQWSRLEAGRSDDLTG